MEEASLGEALVKMDYAASFDVELEFGQLAEELQERMAQGKKRFEIKTDRLAHKTGNLFVEFESRGKPSGLSTTKADYWCFFVQETGVFIWLLTTRLQELVKGKRVVPGGDNNTSKGYLLPLTEVVA